MCDIYINSEQWRQLLNNYHRNRCVQLSFLVEKMNKYFSTSVWQTWNHVISDPAVLNKISRAADFDEVCAILEARRIPGISEKSILHTALHLSCKYEIPLDDGCTCGLMQMQGIRKPFLYVRRCGGFGYLRSQGKAFAELSDYELMCIIVQQSDNIRMLFRIGGLMVKKGQL